MTPIDTSKKHSWFEWAHLLISLSIPLVVIMYTIIQYNNDISIARENRKQDLEIAKQQRDQDMMLAEEQQQDATLVDYFASFSKLLEKNGMILNKTPEARSIARFKTLTTLSQLKSKRKTLIIYSLLENELIKIKNGHKPVVRLKAADLSGLDFKGYPIGTDSFLCIDMSETVLTNASFSSLTFHNVLFEVSYLFNTDFSFSTSLSNNCGTNFSQGISFFQATLDNSTFNNAIHREDRFEYASLIYARLRNFSCAGCDFGYSKMISTDMSNAKLVPYIREITATNINIIYTSFIRTVMTYAMGTNASFIHCMFIETNLVNTLFIESRIINSSFHLVNFTGSSLKRSKVSNTNFTKTEMRYVDFTDGECHYCLFINVDLTETNFSNTSLTNSDFTQTNITYAQLSVARNLEGVSFP